MRRISLLFVLLSVTLSAQADVHSLSSRHTNRRVTSSRRHHRRPHLRRLRFYGPPVAPELRGSRDSLLKQNSEIDQAGLVRIEDDAALEQLEARGVLIPIPASDHLRINPSLKENRRYARPWTVQFIDDMAQEFYNQFGKPLTVTSAVRTAAQQRRLTRTNHNAAPAEGEVASSHLAGTTVDIGKRWLSRKQHKWIADYLARMKEQDIIEPEEERRQACFHVMVSQRYPYPVAIQTKATEPVEAPPVAPILPLGPE
ncbi:MAG TPA: DUF5715 family protein [Terriglobales bacterium]|jgi:hypothetical protein|nr:DUF5715 family protein [Terriglobales bacterium]